MRGFHGRFALKMDGEALVSAGPRTASSETDTSLQS